MLLLKLARKQLKYQRIAVLLLLLLSFHSSCHLPLAPRSTCPTLLMDNSRAAAGLGQQARAIIAISRGAWQCIGHVMLLLGSLRNRTRTWPPEPTREGEGDGGGSTANNKMPSLTWLAKCLAKVTRPPFLSYSLSGHTKLSAHT